MAHWLVKSDPDDYSAADLERDGSTRWDGVRNALAQQHLSAMKAGDGVLVYHSGAERAIVALAKVASPPQPDESDPSGKAVCVQLAFEKRVATPVTLAALKEDPAFEGFDLLRISRLSVMPVSAAHWKRILKLAAG